MTDKVGVEITPGCLVAYAIQVGDSPALRVGKVLRVEQKPHAYVQDRLEDRITVMGVEDGWGCDVPPVLLSKKSTLQFPRRLVVLDPERVDPKYRALLDGVQP
jgi:hypothetical protein